MRAILKSPLFLALAVALATVASGDYRNIEHLFWNPWFKFVSSPTATRATIVSLDEGHADTREIVLTTAAQTALVTRLLDAGAGRIFLDYPQTGGQDSAGDAALNDALVKARGKVILVNRGEVVPAEGDPLLRPQRFVHSPEVPVAFSAWQVNFASFAVSSRPVAVLDGKALPAVALVAAGSRRSTAIYPDFSINPKTIPIVSGRDILEGAGALEGVQGRDLFLTATAPTRPTSIGYFGQYMVPMAAVDISATHAVANGKGVHLGWHLLLLVFIATVLIGRRMPRKSQKLAVYGFGFFAIFVLPPFLMKAGYVATVGDAHVAVLVYAIARGWEKWRDRMRTTSAASGLPNFEALVVDGIPAGSDVVAVAIGHYEQMLASLPRDLHGECARQIARRLSVAAAGAKVYDNDNGYFVWLVQPFAIDALITQFEGLKALFSAPLVVGGNVLDSNVHFGLDRNSTSSPVNRIRSAIVCASEANAKGKLYEEFGRQRVAEAPWELSLNARIDEALRNGSIWLAFQPQYDLRRERVSGAETLIRWTDPERGAIPPDSFIIQAERAGRIDAITYWVLEKTIEASRDICGLSNERIQLSVNLSAWMVDQPGLIGHISDIVQRKSFDCTGLTFEVTETFSMTNRDVAKRNLDALRAMGFRLSIDDFGTGQASLAYLSEIPSDEIKLDRRFVQAVNNGPRDRAIVSNTIQLAHALGQEVVAEGVEDLATLRTLQELRCDIAQGYLLGKPMRFEDFVRTSLRAASQNQTVF